MKFIDLFCGVGGFRIALEKAGHECVFSSDIDKYARWVYEYRFGEKPEGDIRKINARKIPNHDILCAGFPCQSFSIAGKRRGFKDTRGTLFFEIARIAKQKQPQYLFLENVKGLLSHDKGRTFETILKTLDELGYNAEWQVLNSKNFGVPQNRERVFIIGHLRGRSREQIFPFREITEEVSGISIKKVGNKNPSEKGQSGLVYSDKGLAPSICAGGKNPNRNRDIGYNCGLVFTQERKEIREYKDEVPTLKQRMGTGGNNVPMVIKRSEDRGKQKTYLSDKVGALSANPVSDNVPMVQRYPIKFLSRNQKNIDGDYSFTVDGANTGGVKHQGRIRRLTPKECERLQAFPDDWTKYGINDKGEKVEISDTQRYKMIGNAVTVNVVYEIARRLK